MEATNHDNFKEVLQRLPQHKAPSSIWARIEVQLEQEEYLYQSIAELPKYQAPPRIWDGIEQRLHSGGIMRSLLTWSWSVAAGIAILIAAAVGIYQWNLSQVQVTYAHHVEKNVSIFAPQDWDADESEVQEVMSRYAHFCKYQAQNTQDCTLERELEELNTARTELKAIMSQYGEDETLIRQLSELEMDRAKVVKAMVEKIQTS